MPVLTKDKRLTIVNEPDIVWIRTEIQIVKSAALFDIELAYEPNDAYAEIGIMTGGHELTHRITNLDAGYVGGLSKLGWTGSYPTENDSYVYAVIYGPDNHVYRLAVTLWKIISQEGGTFIVDP